MDIKGGCRLPMHYNVFFVPVPISINFNTSIHCLPILGFAL